MSDDFHATISAHQDGNVSEEDQKKAGKPVQGSVGDEHKNFFKLLCDLIDNGEIDPTDPQSLVKTEMYETLDEEWQDKVNLSLLNMANQIRLIDQLRKTQNAEGAIHLETMVEQLWEMKQRIEEHHDVFKI